MGDEVASKKEVDTVSKQLSRLEGRMEAGFTHIETKLDRFDTKYARNDSVMALHEKAFNNAKEITSVKVEHSKAIGDINAQYAALSEQVKNLSKYVIGGVFIMLIALVISKFVEIGGV